MIQYSLDIDITLEGRVIDSNGQYHKKEELITAFIQNQKFRLDDIANFKQICPGTKFWGGSEAALDTYLLKVKHGLPGVRFGPYFPILKTERIPNKESDANRIEDFYRNKNLQIHRSEKTHIQTLCKDGAYQEYYRINFGTQCEIISQRVEEFNDIFNKIYLKTGDST